MADNVRASVGTNDGAVFASDADDTQSPSVHYPFCKLVFGALNTFTLVQATAGLPVHQQTNATWAFNVAQVNGVTTSVGNGVSGTGVQRVTLASDSTGQVTLAAGSATIGALTANQSVNVAQMSGVTITMGNGVSGTGVQRVTLASDSTGQVALAAGTASIGTVQPGNTANTTPWLMSVHDGTTRATVRDLAANDALNVAIVDASGGQITSFGGSGTQYAEDAAHVSGNSGTFALTVRQDTPTNLSGTDGDYEGLQVSGGLLWVRMRGLQTPNGDSVLDDTNDAVKVVNATAANLNCTEASAAAIKTAVEIMDDWDETNRAAVNLIASQVAITGGAGAVAANTPRVTLASDDPAVAALQIMDDWDNAASDGLSASGDVAHDAADAGEPVKLGAKATTSISGLTPVATADRTNLFAGADGVLIIRNHCNLEDVVQERTTNTDGASTAFTSGLAAPGAGIRLWITSVDLCNSSASYITVDLRDGAAGSVLWTLPVPATGGVVKTFDPPLRLTANTALAFDGSAAATTLTISANGFKSKL